MYATQTSGALLTARGPTHLPIRLGMHRRGLEPVLPAPRENLSERLSNLVLDIARHQDRDAFRSLFEAMAPRINGYLLGLGTDPASAEEVVQETMVTVWRKAALFDPSKASASTWVFTIARNLRIDMVRKMKRPEPDLSDPAFVPDPQPVPLDILAEARASERVRGAITRLPSDQRTVLHMAFFEDRPHAQIATELGIPLGTVKSRIRLAFARIRSILGEME